MKLVLVPASFVAALTLVPGTSPQPGRSGQAHVPCARQFNASACRVLEHPPATHSPHPTPGCQAACVAAYAVIARALRYDGSNLLARMILATPGFSYARLNNALGVPSTHDVEKRWKHFCRLTSTTKRAVRACYRAISAEPPVAPAQ